MKKTKKRKSKTIVLKERVRALRAQLASSERLIVFLLDRAREDDRELAAARFALAMELQRRTGAAGEGAVNARGHPMN
jgi:hypothetical protein